MPFEDFGKEAKSRISDLEQKLDEKSEREGELTRRIEHVTAALPSTTWLALAGIGVVGSLGLKLFGRHRDAAYVATFVPALLICGVYNKIVKVIGSDRREHRMASS